MIETCKHLNMMNDILNLLRIQTRVIYVLKQADGKGLALKVTGNAPRPGAHLVVML